MSDLNRLGERGAYPVGGGGGPGRPPPGAPSTPPSPSWVPGHRGPVLLWLLGGLAAVALIALGAVAGWWFLPFVAGLAGGGAGRSPPRWWRRSAGAFRSPGRRPTAPRSGPPRG